MTTATNPLMPFGVLDAQTATRYLTAPQLNTQWQTCGAHTVTTCPSCNGLWRFDQLLHPSMGYLPAQRAPGVGCLTAETRDADAPTPVAGARYAHLCPTCKTDVTDFVQLHVDACTLQREATARAGDRLNP